MEKEIREYKEAIEQWQRVANRIMDNAETAQDYLGRVVDELKAQIQDLDFFENADKAYKQEKDKEIN